MNDPVGIAKARLARVREGFLDRLRHDIGAIDTARERLGENRSAIAEIEHVAHGIHGVGAMLGLDEVGEAARTLEQIASAARSGALDQRAATALDRAIARLAAAVERARES